MVRRTADLVRATAPRYGAAGTVSADIVVSGASADLLHGIASARPDRRTVPIGAWFVSAWITAACDPERSRNGAWE